METVLALRKLKVTTGNDLLETRERDRVTSSGKRKTKNPKIHFMSKTTAREMTCLHSMARPRVADGGTASSYRGWLRLC
jgi:hypothetical protein